MEAMSYIIGFIDKNYEGELKEGDHKVFKENSPLSCFTEPAYTTTDLNVAKKIAEILAESLRAKTLVYEITDNSYTTDPLAKDYSGVAIYNYTFIDENFENTITNIYGVY